jgi:hypothetical protein
MKMMNNEIVRRLLGERDMTVTSNVERFTYLAPAQAAPF